MSRHNDDLHFEFDSSWILPIILTFAFPPVGVFLLIKKYSEYRARANRTQNYKPLFSGGVIMAVAGAIVGSFSGVLMALTGGAVVLSTLLRGGHRDRTSNTYLTIIGDRPIVSIKELAKITGRSKRRVIQDLQRMIEDGTLPSTAYIDHSAKCLVVRPATAEPIFTEVVEEPRHSHNPYSAIIADRPSISIRELSQITGKSPKRVLRDLERLLENGELPDTAYIDHAAMYLVLRPDGQPKHDDEPIVAEVVEEPARPKKKQPEPDAAKQEAAVLHETFDAKLREIRYWNDEIDDERVSARIDDIEATTANIFYLVREKPERASEIRSFMNYYLPTTLKLLKAYARLEKQNVAGENIKSSRQEIERILDKLADGFRQQLDRLFQADAIDISSDIDVLETMMAKDGLLNELKIK